jgi:hypothetical protein
MGTQDLEIAPEPFNDTLVLGEEFSLSSYMAFSILAVCGAGGEFGFVMHPKSGKVGMVRSTDTAWSHMNRRFGRRNDPANFRTKNLHRLSF